MLVMEDLLLINDCLGKGEGGVSSVIFLLVCRYQWKFVSLLVVRSKFWY